jgi:hypothetical protein
LFFNLNVFVLVLKISVLFLECSEISLSILEIVDVIGQIRNEEFLMLGKSWWSWSFSFDHSLLSDGLGVVGVRLGLSLVVLLVSHRFSRVSLVLHSHCVSLVCELGVGSSISGSAGNSESAFILELSSLLTGVW